MTIEELLEYKKLSEKDRIKHYNSIEITEPTSPINSEEDSLEKMIDDFMSFEMTDEDREAMNKDFIELS